MKSARKIARKVILRKGVLDWWSQRRAEQLDAAYLKALATESQSPLPTSNTPALAPVVRQSGRLDRILFIGDCMWEANELFPELRKICRLDVLDVHPLLQAVDEADARDATARAIENYASEHVSVEPDVILFYARPALLSERAFEVIRRRWKCPLLGLNLDDKVEFFPYHILNSGNDDYERWIKQFDLNLTSSLVAADWYKARGAAARCLRQGFHLNERFASPPGKPDYDQTFSFIGSMKRERANIIESLRKHGVPIEVFGQGWPGSRWVDDPALVYRRSQINLGIGFALPTSRLTTLKGRDTECPGAGACYLTTYNWELAQMFDIGREILCYREIGELVEMHSYYARRPAECFKIARAAHRRCLAEHTWEHRFRELFREVGFKT